MIDRQTDRTELQSGALNEQHVEVLKRYDEQLRKGVPDSTNAAEPSGDTPVAQEGLRDCLQLLERAWPRGGAADAALSRPDRIGRFLIERPLGQGGFGVVYLATDPDLNRQVALKVPRLHALANPDLLERFRREARAAAGLDHPNIIPVFEAGEADGACYIASAYCPGSNLAEWLKDQPGGVTPRVAALITARLAEAVAYSHSRGVLHRDIKPSNVMLVPSWTGDSQTVGSRTDELPFVPKLGDFGLAKVMRDALGDGTMEAALETAASTALGTPAYVSPEQTGQRTEDVGPATDVYSLGVVLYELLTGRPPFQGPNVVDVLDQVRHAEPVPLRRLRPDVPRDLETVCHKCLEKEARLRYGASGDLAADLWRVMRHEPIRARRPSTWYRGVKFARRRRVPIAVAGVLLASVAALAWSGWERIERRERTESAVNAALHEAELLQATAEAKGDDLAAWSAALAEARRAESIVATASIRTELRERVATAVDALRTEHDSLLNRLAEEERDRRMLAQLDEARMEATSVHLELFDTSRQYQAYARCFENYGIDVASLDPPDAAALVRRSRIHDALFEALIDWSFAKEPDLYSGSESREKLLEIAEYAATATPKWHRLFIQARKQRNPESLLAYVDLTQMPASALTHIAEGLVARGQRDAGVALLREAQRDHPDDFWINTTLGLTLLRTTPPQVADAVRFLSAAVAIRPDSPGAWVNLSCALNEQPGCEDEAITAAERAVELKPDYATASVNLAIALHGKHEYDKAIAACRQALAIDPENAGALNAIGNAYLETRRYDDAIAEYREAVRLDPDSALYHVNLGTALTAKGEFDVAIAEFSEANRLDSHLPQTHWNLAVCLLRKGLPGEAVEACRKGLHLDPSSGEGHMRLGECLAESGDIEKAIAAYHEAILLDPDNSYAHASFGRLLRKIGSVDEAVLQYREAIRANPQYTLAYNDLGLLLWNTGDEEEALKALQRAVAIDPTLTSAHWNIAHFYMKREEWEQAAAAYREGLAWDPNHARSHFNLGYALSEMGEREAAIAAYRRTIELDADHAAAHCNLGNALLESGELTEALHELRRGHELGTRNPDWPYPSDEWITTAQHLVEVDARLAAVVNGTDATVSPQEQLDLAGFCLIYKHAAITAARLYRDALAEEPSLAEDLAAGHRYNAACAASLASVAEDSANQSLSDDERAAWRTQAHEWLTADLHAWQLLAESRPDARHSIEQTLAHWQTDPDLAPVRETESLAQLGELEQQQWRELWNEVEQLPSSLAASPATIE